MGIGYVGDLMRANVDCECDDFAYFIPTNAQNAAQPLTDEAMQNNRSVYPADEMIERSFFAAYLGEAEDRYTYACEALLAALGEE